MYLLSAVPFICLICADFFLWFGFLLFANSTLEPANPRRAGPNCISDFRGICDPTQGRVSDPGELMPVHKNWRLGIFCQQRCSGALRQVYAALRFLGLQWRVIAPFRWARRPFPRQGVWNGAVDGLRATDPIFGDALRLFSIDDGYPFPDSVDKEAFLNWLFSYLSFFERLLNLTDWCFHF